MPETPLILKNDAAHEFLSSCAHGFWKGCEAPHGQFQADAALSHFFLAISKAIADKDGGQQWEKPLTKQFVT